jgi:hypothetical protein
MTHWRKFLFVGGRTKECGNRKRETRRPSQSRARASPMAPNTTVASATTATRTFDMGLLFWRSRLPAHSGERLRAPAELYRSASIYALESVPRAKPLSIFTLPLWGYGGAEQPLNAWVTEPTLRPERLSHQTRVQSRDREPRVQPP